MCYILCMCVCVGVSDTTTGQFLLFLADFSIFSGFVNQSRIKGLGFWYLHNTQKHCVYCMANGEILYNENKKGFPG